jgi:hypothetical protein
VTYAAIEEILKQCFLCCPCRGYITRTSCLYEAVHVKYLGVIFDEIIASRLHIEMTEAKALKLLDTTPYSKMIV